MGQSLTKEEKEVKIWKKKAVEMLKSYYLSFGGTQFHEYMIDRDEKLLLAKICFAIYGQPTVDDAIELCDGYEENQKENANEILKLILKKHRRSNDSNRLLVGIIVIACKQGESEFALPIFSIFTGLSRASCNPTARAYVDVQRKTYDSWDDWKDYNILPTMTYAFPRHGFFTSSTSCSYEFDENGEPDIEFGTSPVRGIADIFFTFRRFGTTVPLATISRGRTDRTFVGLDHWTSNGGSLTDLETFTGLLSIAATPLHFATSVVAEPLLRGTEVNERISSSSLRVFATLLNVSTVGLDAEMIGFGIVNLIDKNKQNLLTKLDVLQFSMGVFFLTNILIRPQLTSSIVKNVRDTYIGNSVATKYIEKFVDANKHERAFRIETIFVRAINEIKGQNELFGGLEKLHRSDVTESKPKETENSLATFNENHTNRVHEPINDDVVMELTLNAASEMGSTSIDDLAYLLEIISLDVKGKSIPNTRDVVSAIRKDSVTAAKIANQYGLVFNNPLQGVLQERLCGVTFDARMREHRRLLERRRKIENLVKSFRSDLWDAGYAGIEYIKAVSDFLHRPIEIHYDRGKKKLFEGDYAPQGRPVRIRYFPLDEGLIHGHSVPLGEDIKWGNICVDSLLFAVANEVNSSVDDFQKAVVARINQNPDRYIKTFTHICHGKENQGHHDIFADQSEIFPENETAQTYMIMRHILNRYILTWSFTRGLKDTLREQDDAQMFVPICSNSQDNENMRQQFKTIYGTFTELTGITENMMQEFREFQFDGTIGLMGEIIIDGTDDSFDYEGYKEQNLHLLRHMWTESQSIPGQSFTTLVTAIAKVCDIIHLKGDYVERKINDVVRLLQENLKDDFKYLEN